MRIKCLILAVTCIASAFGQNLDNYKKVRDQTLSKAGSQGRQSFFYTTLADTKVILPSIGLGYRAKMSSHFSLDTSISPPLPIWGSKTFLLSEAKIMALYYPVQTGFYLGLGVGGTPESYVWRHKTRKLYHKQQNSKEGEQRLNGFLNEMVYDINNDPLFLALEFSRLSLGYEWQRDNGNKSMFVQVSGPNFLTVCFGIGF